VKQVVLSIFIFCWVYGALGLGQPAYPDAYAEAASAFQQGKLEQAEHALRTAIAAEADRPDLLGLLAVVISVVESRTREIGIRKVFGASIPQIAFTLSKGFVKLIAIAVMIATPVTYLMFDQLLLSVYFYRSAIGLSEIATGVLVLFTLVLLIIGSQTFKVARINPVETLKCE